MSSRRKKKMGVQQWSILLIAVLAVILAVNLLNFFSSLASYRRTYGYDFASFDECYRRGEYPEILRMYEKNLAGDRKTVYDVSEYAAAAAFYREAVYCRMYWEDGQTDKAEQARQKMKEYRDQITDQKRFGAELERIETQFLDGTGL